jgi:hypothetical protein
VLWEPRDGSGKPRPGGGCPAGCFRADIEEACSISELQVGKFKVIVVGRWPSPFQMGIIRSAFRCVLVAEISAWTSQAKAVVCCENAVKLRRSTCIAWNSPRFERGRATDFGEGPEEPLLCVALRAPTTIFAAYQISLFIPSPIALGVYWGNLPGFQ